MERIPLRPVLATIEAKPTTRRPALAEKSVPLSSKAKPAESEEEKPRFPVASVNVESISDVMAARLTTCLLGHVLFLKSQVPFPVAQLIKMASSQQSEEPPNKKLNKLLESFDILSSHLGSTFTALASSLASTSYSATGMRLGKAHLAIVMGPTATAINAARARVVLEVDGLHVALPRSLSDPLSDPQPRESVGGYNSHLKENEGITRSVLASKRVGLLRSSSRHLALADTSSDISDEEDLDTSVIEPPPDSDRGSDINSCDSNSEYDSESESEADAEDNVYQETEADMREAERLLSRTLAIANADPELGMAADLRPTQTYILLRAPRRFSHPSWIPRQDMQREMDSFLEEFDEPLPSAREALKGATNSPKQGEGKSRSNVAGKRVDAKRKGPGGIKTDYVRVRSRGAEGVQGLHEDREENVNYNDDTDTNEREDDGDDADHKDEMIWWSWDGKLEGFTDI